MINDFNRNYERVSDNLNKYMNQLSTGKKFDQVSEAPLDATRALRLKTDIKFNGQYQANVDSANSWLSTTDMALDDVNKTLRAARDLAVQGASGTMTPEDRDKLKTEVDQLREHLIQIGNTSYGDRYVFNGSKTQLKPYQDGNSVNPVDYQLNGTISNTEIKREISQAVKVDINVSGLDVGADTGDGGGFKQIFVDLKKLSTALYDGTSSNQSEIEASIGRIDQHVEQVLSVRGRVGARQERLEMTKSRLEAREIDYTNLLSEREDANIPEVITKLNNEQSIQRAALATGAKIIQPTLMDFLR